MKLEMVSRRTYETVILRIAFAAFAFAPAMSAGEKRSVLAVQFSITPRKLSEGGRASGFVNLSCSATSQNSAACNRGGALLEPLAVARSA